MKGKSSNRQSDKEIRQLRKDLKELGEKIELIGKRGILDKNMTPDELNALLVKAPFVLSSPLKDHYEEYKWYID